MDPLSLATGVIGLAQAVVELVNLAQSLKESFAKISENRKNARMLVSEILESVLFIQKFYEKHRIICEESNTESLSRVILKLRDSLSSVLLECTRLIPSEEQGVFARGKAAFRAWLKRNELESQIAKLRALTDQSKLNFLVYATMDSSVTTKAILATATRLESTTSEIRQRIVVRRQTKEVDVSGLSSTVHTSEIRHTFVTHRRQSISLIPTHVPLAGDQATDFFLRTQVTNLDRLLSRILTTGSIIIPKPTNATSDSRQVTILRPVADYETLQQRIVSQTADLFDLFKNPEAISAEALLEAANTLIRISGRYNDTLHLPREASILSSWALSFYREAYKAHPEVHETNLALALTTLASQLASCPGEIVKATSLIAEALNLYRSILAKDPSPVKKVNLARALAFSCDIARRGNNYSQARDDIDAAVDLLREALTEGYGTYLIDEIQLDPKSFRITKTAIETDDWKVRALMQHGYILTQAVRYYDDVDAPREAFQAADGARRVFLKFHERLPGAFSEPLFWITKELTSSWATNFLEDEETLKYLEEALSHLNAIPSPADDIKQDLIKYSIYMDRTSCLRSMDRFPEAVEAYNLAIPHLERYTKALHRSSAFVVTASQQDFLKIGRAITDEAELQMEAEEELLLDWYDTEGTISTPRLPLIRNGERGLDSRLRDIGQLIDEIANKAKQDPKPLTNEEYNFGILLGSVVCESFARLQKFEEAYHFAQHVHRLVLHTPEAYREQNSYNQTLLDTVSNTMIAATEFNAEPRALKWAEEAIATTNELAPKPTSDQWYIVGYIYEHHAALLEIHNRPQEALEMWKRYLEWYSWSKPSDLEAINTCLLTFTVGLAHNHLHAGRWSAALECTTPMVQTILETDRSSESADWETSDNEIHHWCATIVVLHVTLLQHLGRVDEALGCLTRAINHLIEDDDEDQDEDDGQKVKDHKQEAVIVMDDRSAMKEIRGVDKGSGDDDTASDDGTLVPDGSSALNEVIEDEKHSKDVESDSSSDSGSDGDGSDSDGDDSDSDDDEAPDAWELPLFSLKAFLLSRKGQYSKAATVAKEALDTFDPPDAWDVYDVDEVIATLYPEIWINLSRVYADAGSPAKAIRHAHRAKKALKDILPSGINYFSDFTFLATKIDCGLVLASALLQNRHLEDASKLLLRLVDICKNHVDRRRELYPIYAVLMRLLGIYYCSVGNHAEGMKWRKKVAGLEYTLEDEETGESGEVFEVVKRRMVWEERRPSNQRLKKVLNIKCKHQGPVFVAGR